MSANLINGVTSQDQTTRQTLPVLVDSSGRILVSIAAAAGTVIVAQNTSALYDGTTALVPKFAVINVAGSGDNTIVAAVTAKKIRVLAVMLMAGGTVNARFESGAGTTALTGIQELTAQAGFVLPFSPVGWFETAVNTLLNLELSAAVNVDGCLVYVEVA